VNELNANAPGHDSLGRVDGFDQDVFGSMNPHILNEMYRAGRQARKGRYAQFGQAPPVLLL
jgi:hypothetical protein